SMEKNPDTDILIVGHTDGVGSDSYNMDLSQRRAKSVKSLVVADGVKGSRLRTEGRGKTEPIGDNATSAGRAQNRRVEIVIVANDKMKADAQKQTDGNG
ncbi:MAG: OmpA family protein, partial [Mucilaginibacter polytrichastri]|nr:OmpA family protein [Mucilaginibacter polytrichastri]